MLILPPHVPNGIYRISSAARYFPELYLECQQDTSLKAVELSLGSDAQKWAITDDQDGAYKISCVQDKNFLILRLNTTSELHTLNPIWTVELRGDSYIIGSPYNDHVLSLHEDNAVETCVRRDVQEQCWILHFVENNEPTAGNVAGLDIRTLFGDLLKSVRTRTETSGGPFTFIYRDSVSERWRNMDEQSLITLLLSTEGLNSVLELSGEDAAFVVNILDRALVSTTTSINPHQRKRCTVALRKLCATLSILPVSHLLSEGLEKIGDKALVSGSFADVWEGRYNEQTVAIKVLKRTMTDDVQKVVKSFCKEVLIWKGLYHPNILPFLGVATVPFQFGMVSPWMTHGNLVEYLKLHPKDDDIIGPLLSGTAEGLKYLHDNGLVHGDLKGANIMITDDHQACLADFGLMTIISDFSSSYATTTVQTGGTIRWMAPELLFPEEFEVDHYSPSRQSDVYAFGMVIYEVLTGDVPFGKLGNFAVMLKVSTGERPKRPNHGIPVSGFADIVWRLAEECWDQDRNKRPSIHEVFDRLKSAFPNVSPPHSTQQKS